MNRISTSPEKRNKQIEIFFYFSNIVIWQTYSALFILRSITKYFIEINSEQNLYPYFLPQDNSIERISLMSIFVGTLFRTTIFIPVESFTNALHLEILNTLLSLLSIQMCAKEAVLISAIYSIFMHRLEYVEISIKIIFFKNQNLFFSPLLISEFIRTLLEFFIKQIECPSSLAVNSIDGSNNDNGTLYKIGQSVASMLFRKLPSLRRISFLKLTSMIKL